VGVAEGSVQISPSNFHNLQHAEHIQTYLFYPDLKKK
jgi:hypothetical protein